MSVVDGLNYREAGFEATANGQPIELRSVEEAVAAARRRSGRVAVSSYLLMPGYFHAQVAAARADVTSEPLLAGPTPDDLVNLILQRYTTSIAQAA